jgi:phasin family protein
MNAGTVEAKAEKQAEVVKAAVEKAVANARELTELATKSQGEAFDVLNKRFIESVDEVKTLAVVK